MKDFYPELAPELQKTIQGKYCGENEVNKKRATVYGLGSLTAIILNHQYTVYIKIS